MKDKLLLCPSCESPEVVLTAEQMFHANTFEHYCHSVKTHDSGATAKCLECNWVGERHQLLGGD